MLLPLIFLISGYFSVHNVKAVKIYFPGSCPVNILIHTHDRQAFMAVAERLKLYFSKKYISCKKSGSPRSCCIKLTEKKTFLGKKRNVKKEKQHVILLLNSATSLKSHSNPALFMATFEQVNEVIFVES